MKRKRNELLKAMVWLYVGIALLSLQVFDIPNGDVSLFGRKVSIGWIAVLMAAYNGASWLLRETERRLENVSRMDHLRQIDNEPGESAVALEDEEGKTEFVEVGAVTIAGDGDDFSLEEDGEAAEFSELDEAPDLETTDEEGEDDDSHHNR